MPTRRALLGALLAAALAGGLSACGRKGRLKPPPSESEPPAEPEAEET